MRCSLHGTTLGHAHGCDYKPFCCAGKTDIALVCITTVQGSNASNRGVCYSVILGAHHAVWGNAIGHQKQKEELGNTWEPTVTPTHVIFGNGTWLLIALTYPFFIVIVLNICYFVDVSCQPDGNTYEGSMRNTSRCFNFFEHGKYRYLPRLKNFRNISNFSLRHVIS